MPYNVFDETRRRVEILEKFLRETNISRNEDGSKGKALYDAIVSEIEAVSAKTNELLTEVNPQTASGPFVDLWADFLGVQKEYATKPFALTGDQNVELYVDSGTFADLNNGDPITIPASTFKLYGNNLIGGNGVENVFPVEYEIVDDVILSPGDSRQFITVVGTIPGDEQNIAAGQLDGHNFESYANFLNIKLKVRNNYAITNGRPEESEDRILYKFTQTAIAKSPASFGRISTVIQLVPGVTDVVNIVGYSGAGSVDFFVDTQTFVIPSSLISEVVAAVDVFKKDGFSIYINKMPRIGVAIDTNVRFKNGVSTADKDNTIVLIQNALLAAITGLKSGTTIDLQDAYDAISNQFSNISSLSKDERFFDTVTVYRPGFGNKRYATLLTGTVIELKEFERLLPENGLIKSINIKRDIDG